MKSTSKSSFAHDAGLNISRNELYELRMMGRYREIVEQVIAESTDASPPTRRKVIAAIREHRGMESQRRADLRRTVARLVAKHGYDAVIDALAAVEVEV